MNLKEEIGFSQPWSIQLAVRNAEGLSRMSKLPCWAQGPALTRAETLPQHHPAIKSFVGTPRVSQDLPGFSTLRRGEWGSEAEILKDPQRGPKTPGFFFFTFILRSRLRVQARPWPGITAWIFPMIYKFPANQAGRVSAEETQLQPGKKHLNPIMLHFSFSPRIRGISGLPAKFSLCCL